MNAVASVLAVSVSVVCDQVDQVVPAHQVDDINEVHELDPVHQVDHKDERCDDIDSFFVGIVHFCVEVNWLCIEVCRFCVDIGCFWCSSPPVNKVCVPNESQCIAYVLPPPWPPSITELLQV